LTGQLIRASRATTNSYERDKPGELVHIDATKLSRIPDGGGWRAHGRQAANAGGRKNAMIGFDYVHAAIGDRSRAAIFATSSSAKASKSSLHRRPRFSGRQPIAD
jgi:hypothetical protein